MPDWKINVDPEVEARIMAAANHEEGDRVPIWDYLDNPPVYEFFHREGEEPDVTMARAYNELGIDLCRGYALPLDEEDQNEALTHWFPQSISSPEQLEEELKEPESSWDEIEPQLLECYYRQRDLLAPLTMRVPAAGTGLTDFYAATGLQRFCEWTKDYDELLHAVLDKRAEDNARWARVAARERLCPLFFVGEDIAFKGRLMFSPDYLRRTFIPMLRRVCEPLVNAGVKVIFHSDGYVMEILDDLLDIGIVGLNPIEPLAGMDIGYLKKRYGRRLILVGNVDCSQTLPLGSIEDVREAVRQCVKAASPGGGHFIGSSSEVTPSTPLQNVFAFYDACRQYGCYPIRDF
jgi:hypothetical protein